MNVDIKTRHFQLGDESREKMEAMFEKVARFSPRPINDVKLQIVHENNLFHCDGVLHLKNQDFRAENSGAEPELAVQGVVDVLQRQLEKFKGKISGKQRGEAGGLGRVLQDEAPSVHFASENFELHNMDAVQARDAFTDTEAPFLVYRNNDTGRIGVVYRRKDGELGLMEASND